MLIHNLLSTHILLLDQMFNHLQRTLDDTPHHGAVHRGCTLKRRGEYIRTSESRIFFVAERRDVMVLGHLSRVSKNLKSEIWTHKQVAAVTQPGKYLMYVVEAESCLGKCSSVDK